MPKGYPHPHNWWKVTHEGTYIKGTPVYPADEKLQDLVTSSIPPKSNTSKNNIKYKKFAYFCPVKASRIINELIAKINTGKLNTLSDIELEKNRLCYIEKITPPSNKLLFSRLSKHTVNILLSKK